MSVTLALAAPPPKGGGKPTVRPNVLLITVDSLRVDRLGCYSGGRLSTPGIDGLAARGVRFTRAYAASPSTVPSTATILTGLYPIRHGVRNDLEGRLSDGIVSIAEVLGQAGYRTGAIIGTEILDSRQGLNRGFATFDDTIKPATAKMYIALSKARPAEEVVAKGKDFLDSGAKEKPFFLWLNFFEPHYEYTPPEPLAKEFEKDPYQGEVTYVDRQIAALMADLQARKIDRSTHVVLVGSQGEGLGDHRETGHGIYAYETTIRVPLIIAPAGERSQKPTAPQVVDTPVGLVDLVPTILEMVGVARPGGLDGVSLASHLGRAAPGGRKQPSSRRLFIEAVQPWAAYGWSPLYAVIQGDHKVVRGQRTEAFDLRADPGEQKPLAKMPAWAAGLEEFGRPLLGSLGPLDKERQRIAPMIASLDLPWSNAPYCLERQDWGDPRDRVDMNDKLIRARAAFDKGWVGQAAMLANEILDVDQANFTALDISTFLAVRNGSNDMLMDEMPIFQCTYPYRGTPYHYWAHFRERVGDKAAAEKAYLLFAQVAPQDQEAFYDLAAFYAAQGKKDLAFTNLSRAIELGADDMERIREDPRLKSLHDDPRFTELVGPVQPSAVPGAERSPQ